MTVNEQEKLLIWLDSAKSNLDRAHTLMLAHPDIEAERIGTAVHCCVVQLKEFLALHKSIVGDKV